MNCPHCGMPLFQESASAKMLACGTIVDQPPTEAVHQSAACREIARLNERVLVLEDAVAWISVSDRMPNPSVYDWVLVRLKMNPEGYYGVPQVAEFRNGVWMDTDGELEKRVSVIVTHWMPIPEDNIALGGGKESE